MSHRYERLPRRARESTTELIAHPGTGARKLGLCSRLARGANALNRVSIEAPAAARIDMRARRGTMSGSIGLFPCGVAAVAMRRVAKPCRGPTSRAYRALRMTFLTSNGASPANSVNRP